MRTRIEHVTVVTMNPSFDVLSDASVTFEDDRIIAVNAELPVDKVVDGKQGILMPGMINTHTHLPMIPFRSLQDDRPDRLRNFLFPLEQEAMSPDLIQASAAYGAAESLLSGVTTVLDMYYAPHQCASTYEAMGLRALVGATIINQATPDAVDEEDGFKLAKDFVETWKKHPRIQPVLAPHGTHTLTEDMLRRIADYALKNDVISTIHVSEMTYEMDYFKDKYQCTPIEFLHQIGFLQEKSILAHAIYAQGNDFKLLQESKTKIAHCMGANTKAAKGVAPIKTMREFGITVGLGTDGPASGNTLDLFIQMNLAAKFHKVYNLDRSLFKAQELVAMATIEGAKVLHMDHDIGSIEVGKKADLILIETDSVNMFPVHDVYSVLVYSANPSNVDSVWVDGHCLVEHKELTKHSLTDLKKTLHIKMKEFNAQAERITQSLPQI